MSNSYTVNVVVRQTKDGSLDFTVIFHDGCQKDYLVDRYAFMASRVSERDYVESCVLLHYEEFYNETPEIHINFY